MNNEFAQYIIRFDDLCPTMNYQNWNKIDQILKENNIKPIIAVVPNNEDKKLICQENDTQFWAQIKKYQSEGYMIALHGYNHVYTNHKSGIMGISANSEFVGLSFDEQNKKIKNGVKIFNENGIKIDAFIAPSHSFDRTTIKVLKNNNIDLISDGLLEYPFIYKGIKWIPSQIWDRIKHKEKGIYTVCIHFNNWKESNIENFSKVLMLMHTN